MTTLGGKIRQMLQDGLHALQEEIYEIHRQISNNCMLHSGTDVVGNLGETSFQILIKSFRDKCLTFLAREM